MKTPIRLVLPLLVLAAASAFAAQGAKPLKALLVTGGCCHDYPAQKKIVSEGISARANVTWTIVHEEGDRDHKISIYANPDWAKGYDVIVHNECFGQVQDVAFVERITAPHKAGLPGVFLHCSSHSYRMAETDEWRAAIGIKSMSHEKRRDLVVKSLGTKHPVMIGFPEVWNNPNDECYKNEKIWPSVTPLASVYGEDTKKDHVVIWVNTYGKARTFSTTLGHTNATMASPIYLDLIARGLLWTCDQLTDAGKPKAGYGPGGK
jgi:type 1 glutamine amidotransferase